METTTIVIMIIILGTIWGGLAFTLSLAIKKERGKQVD